RLSNLNGVHGALTRSARPESVMSSFAHWSPTRLAAHLLDGADSVNQGGSTQSGGSLSLRSGPMWVTLPVHVPVPAADENCRERGSVDVDGCYPRALK